MPRIPSFFKIDPIVGEILKAGFLTYKKHYKSYIVLNSIAILVFALVLGFGPSINTQMDLFISLTQLFKSYEIYTQTVLFYGFIGLVITIITYYLTFRSTLRSGELGIEIDTPWHTIPQFIIILFYDLVVFMYLLIWVSFCRIFVAIVTFGSFSVNASYGYNFQFLLFFFLIFLVIVFFLFVVKLSYFIYMLDEFKVPTQALDPIIFLFGFLFGILIIGLDFVDIFFPAMQKISIIITYLTPGTIIMPILGYSMAHLKVASTILGFEPLFEKEEPIYS